MVDLTFQQKMVDRLTEDSVDINVEQDTNWVRVDYEVNSITVEKDVVIEGNYVRVRVYDEHGEPRLYATLEFGDDDEVQDICATIERLVRSYRY